MLSFLFFKQKTADEMRICDWSSDVCSSDLILNEALLAADRLQQDHGVPAEVWCVTSFSELARDGRASERERTLGLDTQPCWIEQCLPGGVPVIADRKSTRLNSSH